jgi:hypothetical protein
MMRTALHVYHLSPAPYRATTELIDDDFACYSRKASAQREDPPSESFRTGEPNSVSNVESSSHAQHDSHYFQITLKPAPLRKSKKANEEIPMNGQRLRIDISYRPFLMIIGLVFFGVISASPAVAQSVTPTNADFVEWDLPSLPFGAGMCPSAIGAVTLPPTGDPVYYVTRGFCPSLSENNPLREGPTMVRFTPGAQLASDTATWRAWNLGGPLLEGVPQPLDDTGGMKITRNMRLAFVRAAREIVRVDMMTNKLTHFVDVSNADPLSISDLALVERCNGYYIDVYTAHNGIIQRLTFNGTDTATVKRWNVGGVTGDQHLSGVAYFYGKIYFSEFISNNIGELDPNTNKVRRWNLADPLLTAQAGPVTFPRQISIDTKGLVWVVTGSGHLVSLNPCSNEMAAYMIPGIATNPMGLATSGGVVGFTEFDTKKVGMLIPNKNTSPVVPSCVTVIPTCPPSINGTPDQILADCGTADPDPKAGQTGTHTDIDPMGEFFQVFTPDTGNGPVGIFRDIERPVGNFWFLQETSIAADPNHDNHRISHVAFDMSTVTSAGLVTGGGTLRNITSLVPLDVGGDADDWDSDSDGGVYSNFGFNVYRKSATSPVRGNLNYLNKTTGEHIKSVTFDPTFTISGNSATFSGTCTNNGLPCTFQVTVQDNGNPGKGKDSFQICGMNIVLNSGTLSGGNIKIHR